MVRTAAAAMRPPALCRSWSPNAGFRRCFNLNLTGITTVDANATGGNGAGSKARRRRLGGNDIGIYVNEGGTLNFNSLTLNANATAGSGDFRGYSEGGYVFVQSQGGNIIGNSLVMSPMARTVAASWRWWSTAAPILMAGLGRSALQRSTPRHSAAPNMAAASLSPPSAAAPSISAKPASWRPADGAYIDFSAGSTSGPNATFVADSLSVSSDGTVDFDTPGGNVIDVAGNLDVDARGAVTVSPTMAPAGSKRTISRCRAATSSSTT